MSLLKKMLPLAATLLLVAALALLMTPPARGQAYKKVTLKSPVVCNTKEQVYEIIEAWRDQGSVRAAANVLRKYHSQVNENGEAACVSYPGKNMEANSLGEIALFSELPVPNGKATVRVYKLINGETGFIFYGYTGTADFDAPSQAI